MTREARTRTIETTMLALVDALAEDLHDDRQVVEAVRNLLESGRVRLIGTFRGHRFANRQPDRATGPLLKVEARLARRGRGRFRPRVGAPPTL